MTSKRDDLSRELTEAAFHPIANDRAADLLADRIADSLDGIAVRAIADKEHQSRRRRAPSGVRGEKVRAFPKGD